MYFMLCYYGRCILVMGVYMYNCMFHVEQTGGGVGSYYSYNWLWKCGTFTGTVCMHACACVCMHVCVQTETIHTLSNRHTHCPLRVCVWPLSVHVSLHARNVYTFQHVLIPTSLASSFPFLLCVWPLSVHVSLHVRNFYTVHSNIC